MLRLLEKGRVTGYNDAPKRAGYRQGYQVCRLSKPFVCIGCDLHHGENAAALAAVTDGPDRLLAGFIDGKFHVDMTTASPDRAELAEIVRERAAI